MTSKHASNAALAPKPADRVNTARHETSYRIGVVSDVVDVLDEVIACGDDIDAPTLRGVLIGLADSIRRIGVVDKATHVRALDRLKAERAKHEETRGSLLRARVRAVYAVLDLASEHGHGCTLSERDALTLWHAFDSSARGLEGEPLRVAKRVYSSARHEGPLVLSAADARHLHTAMRQRASSEPGGVLSTVIAQYIAG